jgi:multidrug efflux pump subunit AcrA (membrane-fusion protein)
MRLQNTPSVVIPRVILAACGLVLAASVARAEAKAPIVVVQPAKRVTLSDEVSYPARLVSRVQATVNAPADGVVSRILAPLGSRVRAQAAIMRIKNTDPVFEYVPVPVETPVAGIVSSVEVTEGTKVTKGQSLATVTDPAQVRAIIEVPASDLRAVSRGLGGKLSFPNLGTAGTVYDVKIEGLSPMVDPASGTATAELSIKLPGGVPPPIGMIGVARFGLNPRQGLQVPEQALVYRGADTFVRIVEGSKAKLVAVKVAATRRGMTEIASGLRDNAPVVVRTSAFVGDGQDVVVESSKEASAQ